MLSHLVTTWHTARAALVDLEADWAMVATGDWRGIVDTARLAEIEAEIARWTALRDACRAFIL